MLAIFFDITARSALLLLAGTLAAAAFRRSAALRHLIWCITLFSCSPSLPLFSATIPQWRILPAWLNQPTASTESASSTDQPPATSSPLELPTPSIAEGPLPTSPSSPSAAKSPSQTPFKIKNQKSKIENVIALLAATYLAGLLITLLPLPLAAGALARLCKNAVPITAPKILTQLLDLSVELHLTRPIRLLQSTSTAMPMTWGIFRPVILLPKAAHDWPADHLRCVLLHELAHIRRRDALTQFLARLTCALYWFHPLAWLTAARMRSAAEHACDDLVLTGGVKSSVYSELLLSLARIDLPAPRAAIAMAQRLGPLKSRLRSILNPRQNRKSLNTVSLAASLFVAFAVLLPLACASAQPVNAPRAATPAFSVPDQRSAPAVADTLAAIPRDHTFHTAPDNSGDPALQVPAPLPTADAAPAPPPRPANPPSVADLRALLDQPLDAPAVQNVTTQYALQKFPTFNTVTSTAQPFILCFRSSDSHITTIVLEINPPTPAQFAYRGQLPSGIQPTDKRDDLIRRLGKPTHTTPNSLLYDDQHMLLLFDQHTLLLTDIWLTADLPSSTYFSPPLATLKDFLNRRVDSPALLKFAVGNDMSKYQKFDEGGFENFAHLPFAFLYRQNRISRIILIISRNPAGDFPHAPIYTGTLPGGVLPTDTPAQIIRRFGPPTQKSSNSLFYDAQHLTFAFDPDTQKILEIDIDAPPLPQTQPASMPAASTFAPGEIPNGPAAAPTTP